MEAVPKRSANDGAGRQWLQNRSTKGVGATGLGEQSLKRQDTTLGGPDALNQG